MKLPVTDILPLIPQKPPFVMVGELIYGDEVMTRTTFTIGDGNVLADKGYFSEAGLMENIAQTAAAGAGYKAIAAGAVVANGYIGAVKNLEIFEIPEVNQQLTTEVTIENQVLQVAVISGRIWCGDKLLAQCEMNVYSANDQ